jgi:predicted short-subunit dehydrogenase-like oxidoreductase (DUF2520 family)
MARKRSAKQDTARHIAIVGAGNLGTALAVALHDAGFVIDQIISRPNPQSLKRARRLAGEVGATAASIRQVQLQSKIVWLCVPDSAIAAVAESLADLAEWKGRVALHSSGALASDELAALHNRGAVVASAHPMMTFVRGSRPSLRNVPFAIEGDSRAVSIALKIVKALHGQAFSIRKEHKAAYHAWGMFSSPLLCALLAASERITAAAGVGRKAARSRMFPILQQTLANYARLGAGKSFSGPIARGDVETVKKHLRVLRDVPEAGEVYIALARAALRELPSRNRKALEEILEEH